MDSVANFRNATINEPRIFGPQQQGNIVKIIQKCRFHYSNYCIYLLIENIIRSHCRG